MTVWTFLNPTQPTDDRSRALRVIVDSFEASHPGVDVDVQTQDWTQLENKYLSSVATNAEPDVLWITQLNSGAMFRKGVIADLSDLLGSDYTAELQGQLLAPGFEIDGSLAQLPIWPDAGQVNYYRSDVLQDAGLSAPPETWDAFTTAAAQISAAGDGKTYGFGIATTGGSTTSFFFNLASGAGADRWNAAWREGTFDFTGELSRTTAQTLRDLVTTGAIPTDLGNANSDAQQNQFVTGRFAIANMYSPRFTAIKTQAGANFDAATIRIAGMPTFDAGMKNPVLTNVWGIVASKTPESPACTAEFIKALYAPASSLAWSQVGGQLPVLKSTLDDPWFATEAAADVNAIAAIIQSGETVAFPADFQHVAETFDAANMILQAIVTDPDSDIDQLLQKAAQSISD